MMSGAGQAIANKLIEKMYEDGLKLIEKGKEDRFYVAGVDLGRRRDKSTVYILDVDWPDVTIAYYKEFKIHKKDPRFWVKVIDHIVWLAEKAFPIHKMQLDQTGLGDMPVLEVRRKLAEKSVPCVVEGVDFTHSMKNKWDGLMNSAILKFERYEIHAPFIKTLVVQLKSIRFDTKTMTYKSVGPSPDHVMALFLAIRAAGRTKSYFGTACNRSARTSPLVAGIQESLKEKIASGRALKASELGPV